MFPLISLSQTQIGQDINGEVAGDWSSSGLSISSDGNIVAIGSVGSNNFTGHVKVYQNVSGIWTQIGQKINGQILGEECYQISLSSNGNIIALGSPSSDQIFQNSGLVRIYQNISGVWTQIGQNIIGEALNDYSGAGLSLSSDGNIVAIGAYGNDGNGSDSGHVRVYQNISGVWTQIGQDINGEAAGDWFGFRLSLSSNANIIAIGARNNDGNGSNSGHVRVYQNISGVWTQIGQDINGEAAGDLFGQSLSISSDGSIIAIGAIFNDGNGSDSGHVRVYQNISGVWTQIGQDINGEAAGDWSGNVNLSGNGNIVVIGAANNDGNGSDSGHVRVYQNISGVWTQIGQDINGEAAGDKSSGVSLSNNGNIVAIGSNYNDGNGSDSGHVRVFDLSAILTSDNFILESFIIYPNPVSSILNITLKNNLELKNVNIYNSLGQLIKTENKTEINISSLSKGNYFVELITNQGKATRTIIID
ncbi:T9SS type A sorting domain-containing protein [Flavobacterium lacisediminis]|uniref:T9SS type A sorting domain-containing protein n=1 Tax=Flavobacterium lacisediminis TaxID=2989705 RepID=A0ABT3EES5_9FLAO|nr:T9SS type A sorting domain-containing protein [Flavobacterium lacisediminis]MCW1146926.1 T9SS type A sorting domain-containing protein [Flavobacterium lacisediminis]